MTSSESRAGRGFPWVLTVLAAVVLAALVALGSWQTARLGWKEGLIRRAEAARDRPPAPLAEVLAEGGDPEFRRVIVDCPGLDMAPFVELQSILDGQGGVRLVSACRPGGAEGPAYLTDRGFVVDTVSARPPVADGDRPLTLTAMLRRSPPPGWLSPAPRGGRFYARDDAAMAAALGVEGALSPYTLFAETSSNPQWAALTPAVPPAAFTNNHLGYAITWFGLAIALIGFYAALLRRRLRPASQRPVSLPEGRD